MAVTMADIAKLRSMTGAGMMDCKNALTEGEGDFDKAIEIIRKKGAKRLAALTVVGDHRLVGEKKRRLGILARKIHIANNNKKDPLSV